MAIIVGNGDYKYRIVEDWAKVPDGWSFKEVGAVGVDAKDNVYAFNRGEHPVMVFDRDGNFLRSWGEGQYPRAHGVHMGPDDSIYLTDDGGHFVRKCSLDGKVLLEIGVPGKPAPYMSGEPFHRCTHTALSPKGEIYVSDGYGNAKVHKYSPDGKLLMSWGEPGTGEGEFNIVHNICTDAEGWVYVADRENHRVQCSTATASTRRSGTTCTARAACLCRLASAPWATSVNSAPCSRLAAMCRTLARGSPSSTTRGSAFPGWVGLAQALVQPSFWRRMGLRWTATATSMSARCRGPTGRKPSETSRGRIICARCTSSGRWDRSARSGCAMLAGAGAQPEPCA